MPYTEGSEDPMVCRRRAVAALLIAATLTVSACAGDGNTASDASAPPLPSEDGSLSAPVSSSPTASPTPDPPDPPMPPYQPLDGVRAGVPGGWKTGGFDGLSFAVPAVAEERSGITEPNADGYVERAWDGAPIPGTTSRDGDGEVPAEYLVQSSTTAVFDGVVSDGGAQVFSLTVPGADVAAGSLDQETVSAPGTGTVLRLHVYIQASNGANYQAGMTASNDSAGQQMVRQFIGALSVG